MSKNMEIATEECEIPGTTAEEKTLPPTRRVREGEDSIEPLNDLNTSGGPTPDFRRVIDAPSYEQDSLQQEALSVRDQPSHEDVRRLEEDKERIRRSNEAKDMVFDAIYDQVSRKIKTMLDYSVASPEKASSRLKFSQLSDAELKRLTGWLIENKPFADIKESEFEPTDGAAMSVEEENDNGIDGVPVFPHGQVPAPSTHDTGKTSSKGKKMVERTNSVLGRGSYGEVRVARHNGHCYAAKELKMDDGHYMDNLYREAANLALLENNNIVKFCGIGVYKGQCNSTFLILTELLATNLHRYLMEGVNVSLQNGISILYNVLGGLEYMHQEPAIIHGDLKTKNILLSKKGIAKIADLGSSHLANDEVNRVVHGTAPYMAPEMNHRMYTEKMDVFAYGHLSLVTLTRWEVELADFNEPCDDTVKEIGKRQELFDVLKGEKLVSDFIPLIKTCLCDEPNQRPSMNLLKTQMQHLRLPRKLPNVSVDTAVRNEV